MIEHIIKKGDTQKVFKEFFGLEWDDLRIANGGVRRFVVGNTVFLPLTQEEYEKGCKLYEEYKQQKQKEKEEVKLPIEQAKKEPKTKDKKKAVENTKETKKEENNTKLYNTIKKEKYKYIVNTTKATSALNVRETPSLTSKVIRQYMPGMVLRGKEENGWLKLTNGGYCILSKLNKVIDE